MGPLFYPFWHSLGLLRVKFRGISGRNLDLLRPIWGCRAKPNFQTGWWVPRVLRVGVVIVLCTSGGFHSCPFLGKFCIFGPSRNLFTWESIFAFLRLIPSRIGWLLCKFVITDLLKWEGGKYGAKRRRRLKKKKSFPPELHRFLYPCNMTNVD